MKSLISFIEPAIFYWRYRNRCFDCGAPAVRKCRTHGTRICESAHCKHLHRRVKASVYGSLTKPFCEYAALVSWKAHLLRCAVSLAVGGLLWVVVIAI